MINDDNNPTSITFHGKIVITKNDRKGHTIHKIYVYEKDDYTRITTIEMTPENFARAITGSFADCEIDLCCWPTEHQADVAGGMATPNVQTENNNHDRAHYSHARSNS